MPQSSFSIYDPGKRTRNTKFKSRFNFSTHKRFQFSRYLNVPDGNVPRSILILAAILIVITGPMRYLYAIFEPGTHFKKWNGKKFCTKGNKWLAGYIKIQNWYIRILKCHVVFFVNVGHSFKLLLCFVMGRVIFVDILHIYRRARQNKDSYYLCDSVCFECQSPVPVFTQMIRFYQYHLPNLLL